MELQRATKPSLFKHSAVSRNGLGSWTTCLLHSEKFPFPTGMEKHNGNFTKRLPCATLLTNDKSMLYSTPKKNAPVGHRWGHFLFFEASFAWNGARSKNLTKQWLRAIIWLQKSRSNSALPHRKPQYWYWGFPFALSHFLRYFSFKRPYSNRITNAQGHRANAVRWPFSFLRTLK